MTDKEHRKIYLEERIKILRAESAELREKIAFLKLTPLDGLSRSTSNLVLFTSTSTFRR